MAASLPLLSLRGVASEVVTEVLTVGYRDPRELLPVLRPLIPAPGTLSAFGNQLVVRTDPSSLASLKAVLLELDRPPANLLISVRRTADEAVRRDLRSASVTVDRNGVSARGRIVHRSSTLASNEVQQLRVLEGREAFLRAGDVVPIRERDVTVTARGTTVIRDGTRFEEFGSGVWVRPRLNGRRVTLDILGERRTLDRRGSGDLRGTLDEVQTSVSGELGRWMQLGGNTSATQARRGGGVTRRQDTRLESGLYVKVERLAN